MIGSRPAIIAAIVIIFGRQSLIEIKGFTQEVTESARAMRALTAASYHRARNHHPINSLICHPTVIVIT